ncbi:MAG: efflux RND transporter permease subunit [Verrucomicrobiota bacterium]
MTLSELSIRRPVFAWMLMSALIVFGAISLLRLGVSQMPDVDFPVIEVRVTWEGASPELIEAEIVDQIEEEVVQIEGLKKITSTMLQGRATVKLDFDISRNVDAALQEVQAAVSENQYPVGVDPPTLKKRNPEDDAIMWIGITSKTDRPLLELNRLADKSLTSRFEIMPGVGEVIVGGLTEPSLRVWVDNEQLKALQLTVSDVVNAVRTEHAEIAAGYIDNAEQEFNVRTMGEEFEPEDIGAILITQRGNQPIYDTTIRIRDVAQVEDGLADVRRKSFISGKRGLGIGIKKQRGANQVEVARSARELIATLREEYPDLNFQINADFSRFVEQTVNHTQKELLVAAILTALICYLFLGSLRSAFNVVLAIPTSILGTFIILYFAGFSLNLFTLLALALAIGIVVDDAIMVLENIVRHFRMGKSAVQAARDGANQVFFAAIATTVVLVSIFLPVAFMEGVIGKFFFQFGITMSAAVLLSTVEALTLTPMRCAAFMQQHERSHFLYDRVLDVLDRLRDAYLRLLKIPIRHPGIVLGVTMLTVPLAWLVYQPLQKEFVPPQDQGFFRMILKAPVGTSLTSMESKVRQVQDWLEQQPDVERWFITAGNFSGLTNEGFSTVTLVDPGRRGPQQVAMNRAEQELQQVQDLVVIVPDTQIRGLTEGRSYPVAFNLRGGDYAVLQQKANEMMEKLLAGGLAEGLDTDFRVDMPELRIIPDRAAAARRGVSMQNIGETIQAALGGVRQGKFTSDGERYDIRVRLLEEQRLTPEAVNQLQIRTLYGELIPLADVVDIEVVPTVQQVSRINQQRAVSVFGSVAEGQSQAAVIEEVQRLGREILPEGYTLHLEGGAEAFSNSFKSLKFTLLLSILLAYMVLGSQFNSFLHPIAILVAVVPAGLGAFMGLMLMGQSVNLFSSIGMILLVGIVTKNSIMLVEFTNRLRVEEEMSVDEALLQAGGIRLRPILMTTAATVSAAIPVFLGLGTGSETRSPMATTIIFGMLISTAVTLLVTPAVYKLLAPLERTRPGGEDYDFEGSQDESDTNHR